MSEYKKLVFLAGDGIGPEITLQTIKGLERLKQIYNLAFEIEELPVGGSCYDIYQTPITDDILSKCLAADAVFLGAVGGPKWEKIPFKLRPEQALLKLRKSLNLYANLRPVKIYDALNFSSPLKPEVISKVDLMIVRELTGDLYFGEPRGIKLISGQKVGINTMVYSEAEIKKIAHHAFKLASQRTNNLCSVDKANVLETSSLWRSVVNEVAKDYPEVKLSHMYVDNAAMQLIQNPKQFDCILTSNMFGDILSDLAATITGSIGMLPSASIGGKTALFEPVHGSAPDIAGQDKANPLASFLCLGMMLAHTFQLSDASQRVEKAVKDSINEGRTEDIWSAGQVKVSCSQMGEIFIKMLDN